MEVQTYPPVEEGERVQLLPASTENRSVCGRTWNWIKTNRWPILKGAVATASSVGLAACGFFVGKNLYQEAASTIMHNLGIGVGLTLPAVLGSILPQRGGTILADWVYRWSFEILQVMTEVYVRAGCPMEGRGFWNTNHPPLVARNLATMAFTAAATTLTALSLRVFTAPIDEPRSAPRAAPLRLLFEGGAHENRRLLLEQLPKAALGVASLTLYKWEGSDEWLYFAYYLFGHIGGTAASKTYLWAKHKIIEKIESPTVKALINKVGVAAELFCFGAFLAWPADESYLLSGAVAGAVKIAVLDKFQALSQNDEVVSPISFLKVENIAQGIFLTINLVWYVSMIFDRGLPTSQRAGIASFLASSILAYPLTRYLAANFHPEESDNPLFNSLRFYFVNYEEALLLAFMFIKDSDDVGIIGNDDARQPFLKLMVALTSLGLAVGNNRALQGIRSHRSPIAVSDLALLCAWFILYRQWLK